MGGMAFLTKKKVDAVFVLSLYMSRCQKRKDSLLGRNGNFGKHQKNPQNPESTYVASTICRCSEKYYPVQEGSPLGKSSEVFEEMRAVGVDLYTDYTSNEGNNTVGQVRPLCVCPSPRKLFY